jgi:DNA-binding transcriptional MocR family regulator
MLRELLAAIERDQMLSKSKLARELKVSEAVIDQALQQLIRMGYLIREQGGEPCPVSCGSCPLAASCGKEILVTYRITDKGHQLLSDQGIDTE